MSDQKLHCILIIHAKRHLGTHRTCGWVVFSKLAAGERALAATQHHAPSLATPERVCQTQHGGGTAMCPSAKQGQLCVQVQWDGVWRKFTMASLQALGVLTRAIPSGSPAMACDMASSTVCSRPSMALPTRPLTCWPCFPLQLASCVVYNCRSQKALPVLVPSSIISVTDRLAVLLFTTNKLTDRQ